MRFGVPRSEVISSDPFLLDEVSAPYSIIAELQGENFVLLTLFSRPQFCFSTLLPSL